MLAAEFELGLPRPPPVLRPSSLFSSPRFGASKNKNMSKRTFPHIHIGLAGRPHSAHKRSSCATGGFYASPTMGQTVSSQDPFNITWDTACLPGTTALDIYLIAPALYSSRIHLWSDVNYALGTYQTTLQPRWWNDSSSVQLQLSIVPYGTQPFLSSLPAGPIFTATYSAPTSGPTPASADLSTPDTITYVNNFPANQSLSKGKIAAGVLIPLLFIALAIYLYLRRTRAKTRVKTQRFSQAIDTRMSTISSDWKSISTAGASAAIRSSIAVPGVGSRSSTAFSFGSIRPISTLAVEGDTGSEKIVLGGGFDMPLPRPGLRSSAFSERVSRVSFAADVRPSVDSRRTGAGVSRAFHVGHLPPLRTRNSDAEDLSPTQTSGPFSLTADDIKARMSGNLSVGSRPSVDEVWASLTMMRTGADNQGDEYLLPELPPTPAPPAPPAPVHAGPLSPIDMMPMPASVMSPDDMLRAYAQSRMASPPPGGPLAFPVPAATYNTHGMRTLYSPTSFEAAFPSPLHTKQGSNESVRETVLVQDDDVSAATAI